MAVNADKPHLWDKDISQSVGLYNQWFTQFAPQAYRSTRIETAKWVKEALQRTHNLRDLSPAVLQANPAILPALRMATAPPLARDRLIGIAGVSARLVQSMESNKRIPQRMDQEQLVRELAKIGHVIRMLADHDTLVWLDQDRAPTEPELQRASIIIADRYCGAEANPIIRNAQETRQLTEITTWLKARHYVPAHQVHGLAGLRPGRYAIRLNVPVQLTPGTTISIPVDVAIAPRKAQPGQLPLLVEAKSAGDFTNVNKRRKEEAVKIAQLRDTYGPSIQLVLFLCGYFDRGYLQYETAEGLDWVWEHRIADFEQFGL